MKTAATALILGVVLSGSGCGDEADQTFLSWYDGWGIHTVWGIGKIASGSSATSVKCGSRVIEVRHVYDTHSDIAKPTATQTREYVENSNLRLLDALEGSGNKCAFQLVP